MAPKKGVGLKTVLPYIPEEETEKATVMTDLERMGCEGLAKVYSGITDLAMVKEFLVGASNAFEGSIRADTTKWKADVFRQAYGFPNNSGQSLTTRKWREVGQWFGHPHSHDGYEVEACRDPRVRNVYRFMAPIINADKPTRLTVRVANTVAGSYLGDLSVDWGLVVRDMVFRLVKNIGKTRPSALTPFLYHIYKAGDVLTEKEEGDYESEWVMAVEGIKPEPVPGGEGEEEEEEEEEEEDEDDGQGPEIADEGFPLPDEAQTMEFGTPDPGTDTAEDDAKLLGSKRLKRTKRDGRGDPVTESSRRGKEPEEEIRPPVETEPAARTEEPHPARTDEAPKPEESTQPGSKADPIELGE